MLGNNMFAYCRNNPVCRIDISGTQDVTAYIDDGSDGDVDCSPIDPEDVCKSEGAGAPTSGPNTGSGGSGSSGGIKIVPSTSGGNMTVAGCPTGEKTEVHHIVEQCQATKSGFSRTAIDGSSNKVSIPKSVHHKISGHYSSKTELSGDVRVRDWLAGKSFDFQYEYGIKILEQMWQEVFG